MALTKIRGNTQIQALTVTNSEVAFPDAANPLGILLAKIQDGVQLVKADGTVPFVAPIAGVTPTLDNHLATKAYVDGVATGLDVKNSVRVISTSNITLSGTQTVDSVALVAGNRVLVAGQTDTTQNGIYVVAAGAWTRAADADNTPGDEVSTGMFTFVEQGTAFAGSGWVMTTENPVVLGTTGLDFAQFSTAGLIAAGAGLTKTGTTIDVVSANGGITVSANDIALTLNGTSLEVTSTGVKLRDIGAGNVMVGDSTGKGRGVTISGDLTIDANGVATISAGAVGAASIANGSLALAKLVSGTAGQIIVVNASGVPTYVQASGDATIDATGNLQLSANSVGSAELANSAVSTGKLADGAVTTIKLANDSVTADKLANGAVDTLALQDASVTLPKLFAVPAGQIIMGTSAGNATVTLSGDVTVSQAGVVTINPATVVRVADIVKGETPTGSVNGINTAFVLANTPKVGTVDVFVNGILQDAGAGNDYTIAGATITMLYTLTSGDKLRVSYFK